MTEEQAQAVGMSLDNDRLRMTLELARELIHFPRQFGTHPGGFVLTRDKLSDLVPIKPAAMQDRQVIEWDKNDIETLKFMKVDVLGLGMLGCLRRCFDLPEERTGQSLDIATIPAEDPEAYKMIQRADTIGTFQIESRAQMSMLPRMKPKTFYDLVIEVAIVRPGPIQGDMVHPYLRRREGKEKPDYPTPELRGVLEKTLGVPLFQEQAMQLAIVCAGFTPGEADQLRRSMATFKFTGGVSHFKTKLVAGMVGKGYSAEFAEKMFSQLEGFGSYGFPESHAASFALIAYASCWVKRHHPAIFTCSLINSQPMGFYAEAQLVRDVREHGVEVRPICINRSRWDCTIEDETGVANLIVWPNVFERQRALILSAGMLMYHGKLQKEARIIHVIVDRLEDRTPMLRSVGQVEDDFNVPIANVDELKGNYSEGRLSSVYSCGQRSIGDAIIIKARDFK